MENKTKRPLNLGLIIGLLGFIAGIFLMVQGDWITGIFGAIASASVAYLSYQKPANS